MEKFIIETDEPMRFHIMKMPNDLRKLEGKFQKNPFVFSDDGEKATLNLEIPKKTSKKIIGTSDLGVVNVLTGEVEGGNFLWTNKQVDEEQFRKVYVSELHHLYNLRKTGLITLHFVLEKLQTNTDMIYIHIPDLMKFGNWKVKKTAYNGIKELVDNKLIAPCFMNGWWFINPHIIFNGSRLTLVTNYTKKATNEQTNDIQMLGKGE